jgi:hypothetical protein
MPPRLRFRAVKRVASLGAALLMVAVAGCGGGGGNGGSGSTATSPALAKPVNFPKPEGRSIVQMRSRMSGGPILAPAMSVIIPGENRFSFALFDRSRKQIVGAPVAVYLQPEKGGKVLGPFVAREESLAVKPAYQSKTVADDPSAAKSVYVSHIHVPKVGKYNLLGVTRLDNRLVAADPAGPTVAVRKSPTPDVGQKAIPVDTPTVGQEPIEKIDTRQPHDDMHSASLKNVLGKKPVVLVFATPQLCQSRVCGPVVDIAEQLKAKYGSQAEFIHMEIYNDNDVAKGFRPQVLKWGLPTEPWVFTIKRDGTIAARIEGAYSVDDLDAAIRKAL